MSHGSLALAPIGNCAVSALVDGAGRFVWACAPRVDGDPLFCNLLSGRDPGDDDAPGVWAIDLQDCVETSQSYDRNTATLRTVLTDARGGAVELVDFCPRYRRFNRTFRPVAFARIVTPLKGSPRIRVRLAAMAAWGARKAERTFGSNHIRYLIQDGVLRLVTTAPVTHILNERFFKLEEEEVFFLGPDEPFDGDVRATLRSMRDNTQNYWQEWSRTLATPLEWQAQVIRAAISLKLCVYEETGAIVAALTTSVPEFPGSGRNWECVTNVPTQGGAMLYER